MTLLAAFPNSTPFRVHLAGLALAFTGISFVGQILGQDAARTTPERTIKPIPSEAPSPENNLSTNAKVALGRQLFFDPRLSGDNTMSCATCHLPERQGPWRKAALAEYAYAPECRLPAAAVLGRAGKIARGAGFGTDRVAG
jgi:cytochrome c peroxidase